jgi:carboxyl-terminal processing protease
MEKKKVVKRILCIVLALVVIAAAFCGGYFTHYATQNSAISSYEWALKIIQQNYYVDVDESQISDYSLKYIAETYLDKYSDYYTAEEYASLLSSNSGYKSGIGVSYQYVNNSTGRGVLISSVVYNSPAYICGLKQGTLVTGGRTQSGEGSTFSSANEFYSFVNARDTGEEFTLITDHGEVTLAREDYTASYCFMSTNSKAWECSYANDKLTVSETVSEDKVVSYLPGGAAYLKLTQFYGRAKEEFAALLAEYNAEGCTSLILDLRSNGGGYAEVMQYISSLFTSNRSGSSSVAMTAKYKNGSQTTFSVKSYASSNQLLPADSKVYVLANSGTASASEALIGVLVSNGIVSYSDIYLSDYSDEYLTYLGTSEKNKRTYGKGIMQSYFKNALTGEVLKLTTAKIYWPNGTSIHDVGIRESDGCNTVKAAWVVTYDDEELQSAVSAIYS